MSTPDPDLQSIHASCDRCRSKKLGCVSSNERHRSASQQCVRCARASVPCVFSRRARNTRRGGGAVSAKSTTDEGHEVTYLASDARSFGTPGTQTVDQYPVGPDPLPQSPLDSILSTPSLWYDQAINGTQNHQNGSGLAVGNISMEELFDLNELRDTCILNNTEVTSPCFDGEPWSLWEPLLTPKCSEHPTIADPGSNPSSSPISISPPPSIVRLTELVINIHKTTDLLELEQNSTEDLGTYPIGQVLDLAQRLSSIIRSFWPDSQKSLPQRMSKLSGSDILPWPDQSRLSTHLSNSDERRTSVFSTDTTMHPSELPISLGTTYDADMPCMLLLLYCYMSLARLYMGVFIQMEDSFSKVTVNELPEVNGRSWSPGIQLGEIFNAGNSSSRMYLAVQMLTDEFQSVEDSLCFPEHRSHAKDQFSEGSPDGELGVGPSSWFMSQLDLARLQLKQETRRMGRCDDQHTGALLEKGRNIKAMLRRQMSLELPY